MIDWTNASLLFTFSFYILEHLQPAEAHSCSPIQFTRNSLTTLQTFYCLINLIIPTLHLLGLPKEHSKEKLISILQ